MLLAFSPDKINAGQSQQHTHKYSPIHKLALSLRSTVGTGDSHKGGLVADPQNLLTVGHHKNAICQME